MDAKGNLENLSKFIHLISDATWISNQAVPVRSPGFAEGAAKGILLKRRVEPLLKTHFSQSFIFLIPISFWFLLFPHFNVLSFSFIFPSQIFLKIRFLSFTWFQNFWPLPEKHKKYFFPLTELLGSASFGSVLWELRTKWRAPGKAGRDNYHFKGTWWESFLHFQSSTVPHPESTVM